MKKKHPTKPTGKKPKTPVGANQKNTANNDSSSRARDSYEDKEKSKQTRTKRQKSRIINNPYAGSSKASSTNKRGADLYFEKPSFTEDGAKQREYIKKRNAIRHKKQRKKRMVLVYSFLGLLILASSIAVCVTLFFNIEKIEVMGESRYSTDEVLSHVNLQIGQNIFNYQKKDIEQQVLTQLPYLESVCVNRKLPTGIVVEVEAVQITYAVWLNSENCYLLLSQSGRAVDTALSVSENVPLVIGVEVESYEIGKEVDYVSDGNMKYIIEIAEALQNYEMTKLSTINASDKYNLYIIYDNQFKIELGSSSNLDYKVKFASVMYAEEMEKGSLYGIINVSNCANGMGSFLEKTNSEFMYEAFGEIVESEQSDTDESKPQEANEQTD